METTGKKKSMPDLTPELFLQINLKTEPSKDFQPSSSFQVFGQQTTKLIRAAIHQKDKENCKCLPGQK